MLLQGIVLGLSLSFMIGPLLFAILQAGIERGFRAGLAVAGGIWLSDVLYVLALRFGMDGLATLTALPGFRLWAGIAGGLVLAGFGLANLLMKAKTPENMDAAQTLRHSKSLFRYALRGFLLNTINPFTVFFWLGIAGAVIIPNRWNDLQILIFFGGMLGTLVLTDIIKAYAAKRIRVFLTPRHVFLVRRCIGVLLLVFGAVLVARTV